jgi:hypothetical protein
LSNILIIGDSFAADWSTKHKDYLGWPSLLAKKHTVTNLAQAGVGAYKVLKQLQSVDIDTFDLVLVSHCSPWRLSTVQHPVHFGDPLHGDSDLIFADVEYHVEYSTASRELKSAYEFFKYHFDKDYHEVVCKLFREKINHLLKDKNSVIINFRNPKFATEDNVIDFSDIFKNNPGRINHLSQEGNKKVFAIINNFIENGVKQ